MRRSKPKLDISCKVKRDISFFVFANNQKIEIGNEVFEIKRDYIALCPDVSQAIGIKPTVQSATVRLTSFKPKNITSARVRMDKHNDGVYINRVFDTLGKMQRLITSLLLRNGYRYFYLSIGLD